MKNIFQKFKKEGPSAQPPLFRLPDSCLLDKNTLNIKELETALNQRAKELGLTATRVKVDALTQSPCVSAGINPNGWQIDMKVNPDFSQVMDKKTSDFLKQKQAQEAPLAECSDVLTHETGHWHYCPQSLEQHTDLFLEPIAKAIRKSGQEPTDDAGRESTKVKYLSNCIQDIIDNTGCRGEENEKAKTSMAGQIVFWKEQGEASENSQYAPLYEAFVSLNLFLWGDKADYKYLQEYFPKNPKAIKAFDSIVKELSLENKLKSREYLLDYSNWSNISQVMAKHLAPLMPESEPLPDLFGSGESMDKDSKPMGEPDPKKEVMKKYSQGKGAPEYLNQYFALRTLYQQLAKQIPIKASSLARANSLPYAHMRHKPYEADTDNPQRINFNKLGISDDGKPSFMVPHSSLSLNYKIKHGIESFPPIAMCILDTSGSMQEDLRGGSNVGSTSFIPWGDKSKYHYALLGFFGILNYLEDNHLLSRVQINAANFSSTTLGATGIDNSVKVLLTPQFGSTSIDMRQISRISAKRGSIQFTISDGQVGNWGSIKKDFMALAKQNQFFHIQLGAPTETSEDLRRAGFNVYQVERGDELSKLMVDLTQKTYSSVVSNVGKY